MDTVKTYHSPSITSPKNIEAERTWSVVGEKKVAGLRKAADISSTSDLPPLRLLILDFSKVNHLDTTASYKPRELFSEIKNYAGDSVGMSFVALNFNVRARFERS